MTLIIYLSGSISVVTSSDSSHLQRRLCHPPRICKQRRACHGSFATVACGQQNFVRRQFGYPQELGTVGSKLFYNRGNFKPSSMHTRLVLIKLQSGKYCRAFMGASVKNRPRLTFRGHP